MAEVAGLILGALPLAIEVTKRYKSMYKAFLRYQNWQRSHGVSTSSTCRAIFILQRDPDLARMLDKFRYSKQDPC
jgi:hypothetical protein